MKPKYRIIQKGENNFIPQEKTLWFWESFGVAYQNLSDAEDWVERIKETRKIDKLKPKVIKEYE